ncbi:unnamed protein product [Rotaria magnacalcarata]|uniref:Uncharacterized protein n=1 Tax=Rotaria magnacalcarata TaxID=392030 RepID=A0A816UE17_9BILA|nr:unnamed protein product [Rotaria magnacalcarata]CAF1976343.1 unnamed protein product [Rotaria magnacalcarata]CAF2101403.1 unnamed protein product [Rotaria magnacalcarata]CAF2255797.1 unnamed protein product [Rotaria magnacalcarata]CAF4189246.1 unnamed protein product [Rotaria magnacalcarata]
MHDNINTVVTSQKENELPLVFIYAFFSSTTQHSTVTNFIWIENQLITSRVFHYDEPVVQLRRNCDRTVTIIAENCDVVTRSCGEKTTVRINASKFFAFMGHSGVAIDTKDDID